MTKRSAGHSKTMGPHDPAGDADLHRRAEREAYRRRLEAFVASRDAGTSLTSECLAGGVTPSAAVAAADAVAEFADEALAIVMDEYRPALQCREGCSYCCQKPGVLITVPELLRLLTIIDTRFDGDAKRALAGRAQRYAAQVEGRSVTDSTNQSVPCPLLVEGKCSVYDMRPLVCRGYNSTSVDACRSASEDTRQLIPIFSVLKDVTDGATVGVAQSFRAAGANDAMVDLGSALNLALASTEPFGEAALEDGTKLPIQSSTWATDLWARVRAAARELGLPVR